MSFYAIHLKTFIKHAMQVIKQFGNHVQNLLYFWKKIICTFVKTSILGKRLELAQTNEIIYVPLSIFVETILNTQRIFRIFCFWESYHIIVENINTLTLTILSDKNTSAWVIFFRINNFLFLKKQIQSKGSDLISTDFNRKSLQFRP